MTDTKAAATVNVEINTTCPCGAVTALCTASRATRFPAHMDNVVGLTQHIAADMCTTCSPEPQRDAH